MKFVCKLIVPGVQSGKRSVAVKWRGSIEEEWKKEEGFDRVEELQLAEKKLFRTSLCTFILFLFTGLFQHFAYGSLW